MQWVRIPKTKNYFFSFFWFGLKEKEKNITDQSRTATSRGAHKTVKRQIHIEEISRDRFKLYVGPTIVLILFLFCEKLRV